MGPGPPKVFRHVGGVTMLERCVQTALKVAQQVVIVLSEASRNYLVSSEPTLAEWIQQDYRLHIAIQQRPLGTGDAALTGLRNLDRMYSPVLILSADCPLVHPDSLSRMIQTYKNEGGVSAVLGACLVHNQKEAKGFGRIILEAEARDQRVRRVIEHSDLAAEGWEPEHDAYGLCMINAGLYVVHPPALLPLLESLPSHGNDNLEYYLPEAVAQLAAQQEHKVAITQLPLEQIRNVNTPEDLQQAQGETQLHTMP